MGHDHDHDHDHGHHHGPANYNRAFAIGISLNVVFVVAEVVAGVMIGSLALLADAGHNASDVVGLLLAWGAAALSKSKPTPRWTYGFRRTSILAALANAILLLVAVGAIAWEAVQRLMAPAPVAGGVVMAVAGIGIVINGVTAMLFMSGRKTDINVEGAYLPRAISLARQRQRQCTRRG